MMSKTDYGPSLFLSLCSLFSRFFVFEREFASTRDAWTSRRMGLKRETVFLFDDDDEREGKETLKEIGSEERKRG